MASLRNTDRATISGQCPIPLFAELPAHSSIPLADDTAVARSGGQERPQVGAGALLLTVASTAAPRNRVADGAIQERTSWIS